MQRKFAIVMLVVSIAALVASTAAYAQITPLAKDIPLTQQRIPPTLPVDLIIQNIIVKDIEVPVPATIAEVVIRNQGTADVIFPAGSVLVRGDAGVARGLAFPPMMTPTDFVLAAGTTKTLTLSMGDVCAAGNPGLVIFKVDPGSVVRETNENNNTMSLQVSSFASGDLRGGSLDLVNTGMFQTGDGKLAHTIQAQYPANEDLKYVNGGTGPALWCPNVVLWRETASPLSAKYGLREVKNMSGKAIVIRNNSVIYQSTITGAFQPGDLPPGNYTFSAKLNPDGRIREVSGNNDIATGITVK